MRRLLTLCLFSIVVLSGLKGQTKTELEEKRKKTLEEISYVDNLLKTTEKAKSESMNAVKIIGRKLSLRESVIMSMRQEIDLITERIDLNTTAINLMEEDLLALKKDYARAVVNSYKQKKGSGIYSFGKGF
jgi:hypothetical protein